MGKIIPKYICLQQKHICHVQKRFKEVEFERIKLPRFANHEGNQIFEFFIDDENNNVKIIYISDKVVKFSLIIKDILFGSSWAVNIFLKHVH